MNFKENKQIDYVSLIYKHFGNVRRARGYYLYTDKGVRLLDMYLCDGRAVLGHKSSRIITAYKRELDKGLFGIFPTKTKSLLKRAVKELFPEYNSAIYATTQKAIYFSNLAISHSKSNIENMGANDLKDVQIYRPFLNQNLKSLFLFLPYPSLSTTIVLYKNIDKTIFLEEDPILPFEASAITSFIYDLIAHKRKYAIANSIKTKKMLKEEQHTQKELNKLLPKLKTFFNIEGHYLFFKKNIDMPYFEFFNVALENKILLSPFIEKPSIFPMINHYTQLLAFFNKY